MLPMPVFTALASNALMGVEEIPLGASYDLSLSRYREASAMKYTHDHSS